MTIPLDDIVDVEVSISAGISRTREFRTLFITNDANVLDGTGSGKIKSYDSASDLESDYSQDVKDAAAAYFGQNRFPNELVIGRWLSATATSVLTGGAPGTVTALAATNDGSFRFAGADITGADLSSSGDYAAIATVVQTRLRTGTGLSAVTVTYDAVNSRFVVTAPATVSASYFTAHSGGTGTDIASLLGLTQAAGANLVLGGAQETLTQALNAIHNIDADLYCVVLANDWANDLATQSLAISWAGANQAIAITDVSGNEVLVANEAASDGARIAALKSNASIVTWTNTLDYKSMSVAGQICSRNLDSPRSAYTLKFKSLMGRTADTITSAQKRELDRKQINVYANYQGNRSFYGEGYVTGPYTWIDIPVYATWFSERMQNDILAYLSGAATKIPQTNEGLNGLLAEMDAVCFAAVNNGGVAPGHLTARQRQEIISTTGDDGFDGELTSGFLNFVSPLSSQTQAQRESRVAPPAYSWIKLSGAMHSAVIGVRVEQ